METRSIDELAQKQKVIGNEIEALARNYKKDPKVRKTKAYLEKTIERLDKLWDNFELTDTEIRAKHGERLDHLYFSNNYYEQIKGGYEVIRADIEQHLETFTALDTEHAEKENNINPLVEGDKATLGMTSHMKGPSGSRAQVPETTQKKGFAYSGHEDIKGTVRKFQLMVTAIRKTLQGIQTDQAARSEDYCRLKIRTIERYLEEAQNLHFAIWNQLDEPVIEGYNIDDYFTLEEDAQTKLINLYEKLSNNCNSSTQPFANVKQSSVKLPKVVLPRFDGNYLNWRQFRDLFTELVHNQDIADCHKMWYLKTSLLGDAEKLVRHFTISDANYAAAWKVITDRYENKRLLVTALINKLLSQSTHTIENASAIKALHDTTQECLLGLQNLDVETTHWDPLLLHILLKKLDRNTHTLWEQSLKEPRALPSIQDFLSFLEVRFQSLEALGEKPRSHESQRGRSSQKTISSMVTTGSTCPSCKGHHQLFACSKFLKLSPSSRLNLVKDINLCVNCLRSGHNSRNCPSRGCTKCSLRHNTLLHIAESITSKPSAASVKDNTVSKVATGPSSSNDGQSRNSQPASLTTKTIQKSKGYVLLGTVTVNLRHKNGSYVECRAILDSGSQLNFITERMARRLELKGVSDQTYIEGIGQRKHKTEGRTSVTLQSKINGYSSVIEVHILPQIVSPQPTQVVDISTWPIPHNIALADPYFNQPREIDLLIGAEIYYSILAIGQIKLSDTLPVLQNTMFGWTVSGKIHDVGINNSICGICTEDERLSEQVERFWRLEDIEGPNNTFTSAERQCENHFNQNYKRSVNGRFIVRLPIRSNPQELGDSKEMAYRRFLAMERKLLKDKQLHEQYSRFMEEYQQLGHMKEVNFNDIKGPYYFMPHHAVIKPNSSTTKFRVVFDASAKTTSGASLNDILHVGPTIQDDVFSILLRFRIPRYVFTADIEKMYRQIQVEDDDQRFQLIFWRSKPSENLRCYKLSTVTYGTACAPYLAIKCLQRLAEEEAEKYPLALQIIKQNFYVDDVLTGSNSVVEATQMQSQLQSVLQRGGFKLRKWCANHPQLLQGIPHEEKELQLDFDNGTEEHIKTMGLTWAPKTDMFRIRFKQIEQHRITKRTVVSDIAHLFDPLGIIGPVVVVAKLFAQKLWALKMDWDASLPQEHHTYWTRFKEDLAILNKITFPRHVFSHRNPNSVQIHIFTDASEKAFGAAAYIRSINKDNVITVRLLCAKSKVAPLKQHTLPRLELCAAKLGAELANRIKTDLSLCREAVFFWTDSEITLAWINSTSSTFQTFVANRVSAIQRLTCPEQWRHVNSKHNAADVLSRGTTPAKLVSDSLWFFGPLFLHGAESCWPPPYVKKGDCALEAKKGTVTAAIQVSKTHFIEQIDHKNSFKKLQRIVAYILRFIKNTQRFKRLSSQLTVEELQDARNIILKIMQEREFKDDLIHLKRYGEAPRNSSIASLTPFVDHEGIIRVGGRLEAANVSYDSKHPILLPYAHPLTKVILTEIHLENRHVGPQALLAISRQIYWPIKGKTLVRSVVQHCVHCARAKPKVLNQLMGNLPPARVQPARPFINAGVDFCGPVWTHFKVRGKRPQKAYIAVFICFATKAVHLELVSDLSTEGFIGALKRFIARRGHCRHIYCDNGTNLIGAKNQLQEVRDTIESQRAIDKITATCSSRGTDFHLIPPRAPHFGGLWEAAVKSAKHLLQSTLVAASLTYEEMETVVAEVEAILNSRPIAC